MPRATGSGPAYTLQWSEARPADSPPALRDASAAYDADTSTVVVFGGVTASGTLSSDTWVWNGQTWADHPAASMTQAPPARQDASMAFDPSLHQLILFGGQGSGGTLLGDTWAWNGASWYQLTPGPSGGPGARRDAALALGPGGDLVLFGGLGPQTVAAPTTTTTTTTTTIPGAAASGPSPAAARPNLRVLGDTWEWTAQGWLPTSATGPSPRWGAAAAYDSTNRTTVLFSGNTAAPGGAARPGAGTWAWDGTRWSRQTPATSPPPRFDAVMADDPVAGGVLLVTGDNGTGVLADGWIWTGSDWQATAGAGPAGRSGAAGAFDSGAGVVVVFAGAGAGGATLADTELVTTVPPRTSPPTTSSPPTTASSTPNPSTPTRTTPSRQVGTSPTTKPRAAPSPTTRASRPPSSPPSSVQASPGPEGPALLTSAHDVRQGTAVQLAGSGFAPGTTVTITFRSPPTLVGRSTVGPSGAFTATVSVPLAARPGQHHFEATGTSPQGRPTALLASVVVMPGAGHSAVTPAVKAAMLGLALLIPGAAWLGMTGAGWWRRRSRTGG